MSDTFPEEKAKEIYSKYNPSELVPFPFENILNEETALEIRYTSKLGSDISGAILYVKKEDNFIIVINNTKPKTRQYFTVAHEFGHFFLHSDRIKKTEGFIDSENTLDGSSILFRKDIFQDDKIEREANRFAATLLMPEHLVLKAWRELTNVDQCAEVFNVSVLAMSIRLEKLGIPT